MKFQSSYSNWTFLSNTWILTKFYKIYSLEFRKSGKVIARTCDVNPNAPTLSEIFPISLLTTTGCLAIEIFLDECFLSNLTDQFLNNLQIEILKKIMVIFKTLMLNIV